MLFALEEKKSKKKKMNNFQNLRSIYIIMQERESKFSWVVSCMAIVELQFGVSYASFYPFFAEHLPYQLSPCQSLHRDRYRNL